MVPLQVNLGTIFFCCEYWPSIYCGCVDVPCVLCVWVGVSVCMQVHSVCWWVGGRVCVCDKGVNASPLPHPPLLNTLPHTQRSYWVLLVVVVTVATVCLSVG